MTTLLSNASMVCRKFCGYLLLVISILTVFHAGVHAQCVSPTMTVNETASIAAMTSLIQGSGVTITNMVVTSGADRQVASFTNTNCTGNPLAIPNGMLLSTGRGNTVVGNNNSSGTSFNNNTNLSDPDLIALGPLATFDVVIVEFDVVPKTDTMQLEFQWGSEEYLEYTCSDYNDVFAFLVSGPGIAGPYMNGAQNFAKLPDNTPVSIGTVNQGSAGAFGTAANCASFANTAYFINNTGNTYVQADGMTTKLKVKGVVTPCSSYHVKCVLADASDNDWDSWVWLDGFSSLGQAVTIAPTTTGQQMIEGCNAVTYKAHRIGDLSVPVTVNLSYGGTATNGIDYTGAPSTLVFGSGVSDIYFTLTTVQDALTESPETVNLTATWNVCSQAYSAVYNFTISDRTVTIACPANINTVTSAGSCGAVVNYSIPVATDNCSPCPAPASVAGYTLEGVYNGHTYFKSTTSMTWQAAHDAAVAVGGHLATITTSGEMGWINTNATGNSWIGYTDQDVEGVWSWVTGEISVYTNWLAGQPDNSGNEDFASTNFVWADRTGASLYPSLVEFDCSMSMTAGLAPGSTFPTGTTAVTYQATNGTSTASCSFNVIVTDNINPAITCPSNIIANTDAGFCSATIATTNPVTSDNCGVTKITWALTGATTASSPATGLNYVGTRTFTTGTTTVTYIVSDAAGNTATCSYTVIVTDNINPVATCSSNLTYGTTTGACTRSVAVPNPTISDNCTVTKLTWVISGVSPASSPATGINYVGTRVFNPGVSTITYTITDNSNNVSTCSFTLTVTDSQNPTINCPGNANANAAVGLCAKNLPTGNPTYSDNCGVTRLTWAIGWI